MLLALSSATYAAEAPRYLGSVWERWSASDPVCTGLAAAPVPTGTTRRIDGSDRDQLSSKVRLETCFQRKLPGLVSGAGGWVQRHGEKGYSRRICLFWTAYRVSPKRT